MARFTLKEVLVQAQAAVSGTPVGRSGHGRRRAVIQCVHANGARYTVGVCVSTACSARTDPSACCRRQDLSLSCKMCLREVSPTALNLSLLRAALGRLHNGVLKIDRDEVGTRLQLDE